MRLRKGGKLILVGLFGGEIKLSIASTILRAITVQGSHLGSVDELKAVVALAREGKIKPIPIETRPLSEVSRTLDELKAGSVLGRVVAHLSLTGEASGIHRTTGQRVRHAGENRHPCGGEWGRLADSQNGIPAYAGMTKLMKYIQSTSL